jgi:hypothetical protein
LYITDTLTCMTWFGTGTSTDILNMHDLAWDRRFNIKWQCKLSTSFMCPHLQLSEMMRSCKCFQHLRKMSSQHNVDQNSFSWCTENPPLFIEMTVPSYKSERSCIYVLGYRFYLFLRIFYSAKNVYSQL